MKFKRIIAISALFAFAGLSFGVISNKNAKQVKADGIVETKFCFHEGYEYVMDYNSETSEYYIENIYISTLTPFTIKQGEKLFGISYVDSSSEYLFVEIDIENYIYVKTSDYYSIYFDGEYIRGEADSTDPEEEARVWAEGFIEYVGCDDSLEYNRKPTNWDLYSDTFYNLSNDAKDILIAAEARNDEYASFVEKAAFIHDMCVVKYDDCNVFMYREGGGSRAINIPFSYNVANFNTTALIIVVAGAITVTSLLGLAIFKKNKSR